MEKSLIVSFVLLIWILFVALRGKVYLMQLQLVWPNKFAIGSELDSAFKTYTLNAQEIISEQAKVWDDNWNWMNLTSNTEFQQNNRIEYFDVDNTQKIKELDEPLSWMPESFGYSPSQSEMVFPNFTYPTCISQMTEQYPNITFDMENNQFSMSCPGEYILEPKSEKMRMYFRSELDPYWKIENYQGDPISMYGFEEYVYAKWEGSDKFTNAVYLPRRNETAYQEAIKKSEELDKGLSKRPLHLMCLTIDSYSRKHFFRKLPKTVQYLNQLTSDQDFGVFDFKLHNILSGDSVENMIPVLSDHYVDDFEGDQEVDHLGSSALWNIFRDLGFISVLGFEDCDYRFPISMGRRPHADHLVRSFYCAAFKHMNLRTSKGSKMFQRCIGPKMSHQYLFDYTHALSSMYPGANLWFYNHVNTAHEQSGQHAATLDDDLVEFLRTYIEKFSAENDIVILLHADHGMRFGNWFKDVEAFQENKLPAFFFIAPNQYLKSIDYAYDILSHNALHLTSKQDLRLTMLDLAHRRYDMNYTKPKNMEQAISLISEKSPTNRTCDSIGIEPSYWSCLILTEIDSFYYNDDTTQLGSTLQFLAEAAVTELNRYSFSPNYQTRGLTCQQLTLSKITLAFGVKISPKLEEFRIQFQVKESEVALFEVVIVHGTEQGGFLMKSYNKGPAIPYFGKYKNKARIFGIMRKDPYAGNCELLSRAMDFRAEFCICQENICENFPTLCSKLIPT